MKNVWNSFKIAFSMYSKIPMPYADWTAENMQYAMCFFPLIGAVIGVVMTLLATVMPLLPFHHSLKTVLYLLVPILITGGIHIDGFLDTCDALSSWQPIERRLEILKDPHTGAFAIISAISYYLLAFGIWSEAGRESVWILSIGFVLSRAMSGYSVVTFRMAKNSGLAATFSEKAKKKRVRQVMVVYFIVISIAMILVNWLLGVVAITAALLVFWYYHRTSYKNFGGITGDLAGYFLCLCELFMAIAVIIVENIAGSMGIL